MQKSVRTYFVSSFVVTAIGMALALWIGGLPALFLALLLAVLEVSLSIDNAVVNATVLRNMTPIWRHRFLTWGMIIAVFGMRILFPVLIVSVVTGLSPLGAFLLALKQPDQYAATLTSAHIVIAGFGGAFLLMVFLKFFLNHNKSVHWINALEKPLSKIGKMDAFEIALCIMVLYGFSTQMAHSAQLGFLLAGLAGIVCHIVIDGMNSWLAQGAPPHSANSLKVVRGGVAAFLYLEVLDASFSFDGVIGAFAISTNIFIIAIGLGIGAMFVRSLTIYFVEHGTLEQFLYLEHGAFYAIGALAMLMFFGTLYHVPEVVVGGLGAAIIGLALISSALYNRKHHRS